jgi:multisubunit Na+/H+ antiporter MnhF subunit
VASGNNRGGSLRSSLRCQGIHRAGSDTTNTLVVALLVVLAMMFNQVVFVDVAIVYAVLSFIMTLYIARFIEGKKF